MDIDAFVAVHNREWERLDVLLNRAGGLSGDEAEELVELYQKTATHLSILSSAAPDPALLGRLSALVARARSAVAGASTPARRDVADFFRRRFPAAVYLAWPWWAGVAAAFFAITVAIAIWVDSNPGVQAASVSPEQYAELTRPGGSFESYYYEYGRGSFAAQVWTNNAWVAAAGITLGVLIVPVFYVVWMNAANLGVALGLMSEAGRLDTFLGLLLPHGLLELTAVFVACGVGLRVGWAWIDPGPRTRGEALAETARAAMAVALGLVVVLAVAGTIEGFVTGRGWATPVRIGIGVTAEVLFLAWVFGPGRRAARSGYTGDAERLSMGDTAPVAG
ncbi:MAG: stage II sporulation protein M [Sporichthyaceae bacterium]